MMKFSTAVARTLAAAILTVVVGTAAAQQAYPSKPIRLIVQHPPGSTQDVVGRLVGQKLTESWGQPVIVDNRPGGNTIISIKALLKSLPNGYTLMTIGSPYAVIPQLLLPVPYDPIKDFAPVATIGGTEFILVINPSVPANNLQEVIALLKAHPGKFNYASAGVGSSPHVASELFNIMAGVKMEHIPYKGGISALTDLIAGRVQMFIYTPINCIPFVKSGQIKAIAISGETRLSALPQVPTFTEAGLPGFDVKTWLAILAPAGTPKQIIDKIATEIARILDMPDFREMLVSQGLVSFISTSDQFAALIKADVAKFAKVIKAANIKPEQ